ncbi:MAG: hypothetical protein ACK42H_21925 [Planctomycetota bacterium]
MAQRTSMSVACNAPPQSVGPKGAILAKHRIRRIIYLLRTTSIRRAICLCEAALERNDAPLERSPYRPYRAALALAKHIYEPCSSKLRLHWHKASGRLRE